jgi:hypothetical protein
MTAHIIGCGETGAFWDGQGESIGVNDCIKFGNPTGSLIVVNSFTRELERQKFIADCRPVNGFYSNLNRWAHHPDYKPLRLKRYTKGGINIKEVYHTATSTFIAISLAASQGFTDIVLYGVDFTNHRVIKGYLLADEVDKYRRYCKELNKLGVNVYLYQSYGALKSVLPEWPNQ